jgi:hypothetical protein
VDCVHENTNLLLYVHIYSLIAANNISKHSFNIQIKKLNRRPKVKENGADTMIA